MCGSAHYWARRIEGDSREDAEWWRLELEAAKRGAKVLLGQPSDDPERREALDYVQRCIDERAAIENRLAAILRGYDV